MKRKRKNRRRGDCAFLSREESEQVSGSSGFETLRVMRMAGDIIVPANSAY